MTVDTSKFSQFQYPLKKNLYAALTAGEPLRSEIINQIAKELKHEDTVTRWTDARGDYTHRLQYELSRDSVVFDVGGYKGEWAASIYCLYACKIHVFEPILGFADIIEQKFGANRDIRVHKFGLSRTSDNISFSSLDDGTTQFHNANAERQINARVMDVAEFFEGNAIREVDLMKLNVEGAEYDIIEKMIESSLITRVKNLQIQFHDFVPNAEHRRMLIQQALERTHVQTYNYDFVWEGWSLRT